MSEVISYILVLAMLTNFADVIGAIPLGVLSVAVLSLLLTIRFARDGLLFGSMPTSTVLILVFFGIILLSSVNQVVQSGYRVLGPFVLISFIIVVFPVIFSRRAALTRLLWSMFLILLAEAVVDAALYRDAATFSDEVVRSYGFNMQPNLLAALYGIMLPYMLYLFSIRRWGWQRLLIGFAILVVLYATYLTGSRSGLVVTGFGVLLYALYRKDRLALLVGLLTGVGVALLGPEGMFVRFTQIGTDKGLRLSLFERGLELIRENPLLGHGFRQVATRTADLADKEMNLGLHNSYLTIAAEFGLPMLALFLAAVLSCAIGLYRHARSGELVAGMALISLLTLLLSGMTNHFIWLSFPIAVPFVINAILSGEGTQDVQV